MKRTIPITEEIYQVGGSGLTAAEDAAIYAVVLSGRGALIDAGCGGGTERLLGNLESIGVLPEQVRYLLLTHCHYDHTGACGGRAGAAGVPGCSA
ncbi:MAG: MBL fold metallo-hydrolase [Pseudomonadota bacterium]|nr:MBL fold metallo-hydrolase [Pseudomonadota bacterium]